MPQFSVIIPTRDRPQFLEEAVASVLDQSVKDLELLVVNDGSAPIQKIDDRRVRVVDNSQQGAVAARNRGVAQAAGTIIAFLDDDDQWIARDHLAVAQHHLRDQVPFYFADGIMRFPGETEPRKFARDADAASLAVDNTILISSVCYARALHDTLGLFDESLPYYWDWDWYLRVARAGFALHRRAAAVVDIRIHAHNMSGGRNIAERQANLDKLAEKHGLGRLVLKNHADFSA